MCTLTFIPLSKNNFILTDNRDENRERKPAIAPKIYNVNHINVVYPKDLEKGGTWIAASQNNFTLCLFNGAKTPHISKKYYRKSRGLVLLDFFNFNNINQFVLNYDFRGIEPFTLIVLQHINQLKLYEISWNGKRIHLIERESNKFYIWSSVLLYNNETINNRKDIFNKFINEKNDDSLEHDILKFHGLNNYELSNNNMKISTENIATVSISQVVKNDFEIKMKYFDLRTGNNTAVGFEFAEEK